VDLDLNGTMQNELLAVLFVVCDLKQSVGDKTHTLTLRFCLGVWRGGSEEKIENFFTFFECVYVENDK
jgi:hypothetical protein